MDAGNYNCSSLLGVLLFDADLNQNSGTVETITVLVYSTIDPTGDSVILTETGPDTGIFEGSVQAVAGSPGIGQIQVSHGDTVTAEYDDADCGGLPVTVNDTATVDCQGPVISNVAVVAISGFDATITWDTNESSISRIRYSDSTPPGLIAEDLTYKTAHSLTLTGLTSCTPYYFQVEAEDEVGNTTFDDSGGSYYTFTTLGTILVINENMDTDPGWTTEGAWAWGAPTGGGGSAHGNPDPSSGYTGSNVYGYNLSGDYPANLSETNLTTDVFDCTQATSVTLRFYRWLNVEHSTFDHAYIRYSNDNGSNWHEVWANPDSNIEDNAWSLIEFDLTAELAGYQFCQLRWVMGSTDTSYQFSGWNIDDVEVIIEAPCGTPTSTAIPTETPTATATPLPCSILLVDDDPNDPDCLGYYTAALTALGYGFSVFDVGGGNADGTEFCRNELV